jgi:hypothetical protein
MMGVADLKDDLDRLVADLGAFPEGAAIEEIAAAHPSLSRRTLQRRLASLVETGRIQVEGAGRSRRYLTSIDPSSSEEGIPLSPLASRVRRLVRLPLAQRQPVTYQRAFLDAYRPNETFYLEAESRRRLAEVGLVQGEVRPAGTYARRILNRLLIDLAWNSSRLEGNTYSLLETDRLLQLGEVTEGKTAVEAQMILNHKAAIEFLVENAEEIGFNRYSLLNLHGMLANNLLLDPLAAGRLRQIAVGISGTVYLPTAVPQLIEECFGEILSKASAITDPFEQAFFTMVHLPYLQPFEDVNKRVSRLAANIPLVRGNYCPVSFVDVPESPYVDGLLAIYELNRIELLREVFVWAYERSCARYSTVRQSLGQPDLFRMRHRLAIAEIVGKVVRGKMDKKAAAAAIRASAIRAVSPSQRPRFIEVVETEVMSLHEGNFARYRLRPSEFEAWQAVWA